MKTTAKGNVYRGPSTSQEYNEDYNNIADDLQQLFDQVNEEVEQKETITDILSKENMFLYNKIQTLHAKFVDLKTTLDDVIEQKDSGVYQTSAIFTSLNNIQEINQTNIDPIYRYATLKESGRPISRTHIKSGNELYIPDGLKFEITESTSSDFSNPTLISSDSDGSLFNMVDQDAVSYFRRDVAGSENGVLYIKLKVTIPLAFVNSLAANEILVCPFPSYTMSLVSLSCKNTAGNIVDLLSYTPEQQELAKTSLRFNTLQATEYTLIFKQRPIKENNNWKFVYGFQYFDVLYNEVLVQEGSFITKFTLPTGHYYSLVNKPSVTNYSVFSQQPTETLVDYKLYYDDKLQIERRFGEQILAQVGTIYIKTIIKKSTITNTAPVLSGYTFTYFKNT